MWVKALAKGIWAASRRWPGDVFEVPDGTKTGKWMVEVQEGDDGTLPKKEVQRMDSRPDSPMMKGDEIDWKTASPAIPGEVPESPRQRNRASKADKKSADKSTVKSKSLFGLGKNK